MISFASKCILFICSTNFSLGSSLVSTNMSGVQCFATETIWFDKPRYDEAERRFYEGANGPQV